MHSKTFLAILIWVFGTTVVMANVVKPKVESELDDFREALSVYRAANYPLKFNNPNEIYLALISKFKFEPEKLGKNKEILDPWGRPYIFTTSIDGNFAIISLGDPKINPVKPYLLVVLRSVSKQ